MFQPLLRRLRVTAGYALIWKTILLAIWKGWGFCRFARQIMRHIRLDTAPAAQSIGVASDVNAPLYKCLHGLCRGAQTGFQTAVCSDATLSQQEKSTRQMSGRAE